MASSEARGHNMMMKLYEADVMSWNAAACDGCILQQSFWIHPSLLNIKVDISCVNVCFIFCNVPFLPCHLTFNVKYAHVFF